jgi:hypothetical protein
LLRELTFVFESNDYGWAWEMKLLLQEACIKVSKREKKQLNNEDLANLHKRYRVILTNSAKELPVIPPKPSGKRGKLAKSVAHNLLERMQTHEVSVLLFAKDPYVSFTNNRAEQDLRMSKVKQKVSGCFRTEIYAQAYCRISSYLQTMANKGYNPLIAVQMALAGELDSIRGGYIENNFQTLYLTPNFGDNL